MNNNTFIHKYLKPLIRKSDHCVDMTAGNGNDTLFLAELCEKVYAFDIQQEAIKRCKERLKDHDNVVFINDNHINIDNYVKEKVRLAIFNLGYLPGSESKTITRADDTLIAFVKAYAQLTDDGYLIITFYTGHEGGKDEYYLLERYIQDHDLPVLERYRQDRRFSPLTLIIRKN